jgi:hypothetical protein
VSTVALALVALTIAAAGAGVIAGTALTQPAPPTPAPVRLAVGPARLTLPHGWEPRAAARIPGLTGTRGARAATSEFAIDVRAPENSRLLPAPLVRAAPAVPPPLLVRAGRWTAWSYTLAKRGSSAETAVLVLPTTRGVVTFACRADEYFVRFAADDCHGALTGLRLAGATALAPAPAAAARMVAGAAFARLDRRRAAGRRALARAEAPRPRALAARRIAAAYDDAADAIARVAAGPARRVAATLRALARHHRRLARAGARRDRSAARRVGRAIDRAERRLAMALAALRTPAQPSARSAG